MADVESGVTSTRKQWMTDFDMETEARSRANCLEGFSIVKQPFSSGWESALRCGLNVVAFDSDLDMVQAASQRLGNIADEPDGDLECLPLDETAKLEEAARTEEGNLKKKTAHAKELAAVAADLDEMMSDDGADEQAPETRTNSEQPESPVSDALPGGDAAENAQGEDAAGVAAAENA
ncbi:hypothetical protein CYMTET_52834 [Cymbomonas tetramitiformis]|uniref:Uncharacterized protein n=1 Tax=Cymbomonas tetramitiformis TaxID=36881 RepID=A0AAE0BJX8_9CHLO|nr:hypothetical protein CYMTET_52834 [Cymbomonas tetramitiformis]